MRIDAFQKLSQVYQVNSTKKTVKSSSGVGSDKLEISQVGKDYQTARTAVAQASDIREDKVQQIKQRIASGTYNVSCEDLADRLLSSYYNKTV